MQHNNKDLSYKKMFETLKLWKIYLFNLKFVSVAVLWYTSSLYTYLYKISYKKNKPRFPNPANRYTFLKLCGNQGFGSIKLKQKSLFCWTVLKKYLPYLGNKLPEVFLINLPIGCNKLYCIDRLIRMKGSGSTRYNMTDPNPWWKPSVTTTND